MKLSLNEIAERIYDESLVSGSELHHSLPEYEIGWTIPTYFPKFGEMGTVLAQYKKFMLRHSDWYNSNLFYHFYGSEDWDGCTNGSLIKFGHSYMGFYNRIGDKHRPYIKVFSHFMPYSLREGMEMLKDILDASELAVFAVTPYLSNMLRKLGYCDSGIEVPQVFAGEVCMKHVWTNRPLDARELRLAQHLLNWRSSL